MEYLDPFIKFVQQVPQWNTTLLNIVLCLLVGRIFKWIPSFPNKWIPLLVVVTAVSVALYCSPPRPATMDVAQFRLGNLVMGLLIGFGTWTLHAQAWKRILGMFGAKDDDDQPPPATPPPPATGG